MLGLPSTYFIFLYFRIYVCPNCPIWHMGHIFILGDPTWVFQAFW